MSWIFLQDRYSDEIILCDRSIILLYSARQIVDYWIYLLIHPIVDRKCRGALYTTVTSNAVLRDPFNLTNWCYLESSVSTVHLSDNSSTVGVPKVWNRFQFR